MSPMSGRRFPRSGALGLALAAVVLASSAGFLAQAVAPSARAIAAANLRARAPSEISIPVLLELVSGEIEPSPSDRWLSEGSVNLDPGFAECVAFEQIARVVKRSLMARMRQTRRELRRPDAAWR